MVEIEPKILAYICLGGGAVATALTAISAGGLAFIFGPIAAIFFLASLVIYKYGYFLIPFFTKFTNIIQIIDTYEIPPAQDVILKEVGGVYYASAFLAVKIYESTTDKSPDEIRVYSEYFERAISSVKFVVKFCMMLYIKDVSKYRESIETRRAEAQLRLARERDKPDPDILKLDRYEREVAMWDAQLSRIAGGLKPMGATFYAMTTATGVSKDAATAAAKAQANELKATVSNALNTEVIILAGEDMKKCFEWEYFIPPTPHDLETSVSI
ncbi:hypothetical protein HY570_01255 [Candidatus Micrarchaeota archaeon]|nr:hypothetical protein [Candidatus Micrarchaeota archaeon]